MSTVVGSSGEATSESVEVHAVDGWALVVQPTGAVEARTHWSDGEPKVFTTAPATEAPRPGARHRYGLSIEQVLTRYAHETRFERELNNGEHGAALRSGIIEALCELAPSAFLGEREGRPIGVIHVNAPTGPSTSIVTEDTSDRGNYATFHPFVGVE